MLGIISAVERLIGTAGRDEFVVRAELDDVAIADDGDAIGIADRREPLPIPAP